MIRTKLLYLLILAIGGWLCMLYTFRELRFLMGILLVIPVLCLFSVLFKKRVCRVEAGELPYIVTRGEDVKIYIKIIYKGIFPLAGLRVRVKRTAADGKVHRQEVRLRGMRGRGEKLLEYDFPTVHCGMGEAVVTGARLYDCLNLFSASVKYSGRSQIFILPVFLPLSENESEMLLELIHSRKMGAGDGDYYVREYRPGDSQRSIHWKLTAKEEEIQVKDFEADNSVTLFLNMTDAVLAEPERKDAFLDKAWSVMVFFAEAAADGFVVCWVQEGLLQESRIEANGELCLCIRRLLEVKKVGCLEGDRLAALRLGCHLEEDGRVYVGERCACEE